MSSRSTILIVDDTPQNIDLLLHFLDNNDYSIAVATSGESAIAILPRVKPDLIFLDVVMPGIDGYDTCEKIKSDPAFADIPVIFVTGKTEISDLKRGFDVGGSDYIYKPMQKEEVLARARTHLSLRHLTKDMDTSNKRQAAIINAVTEGTFCINDDGLIDCVNLAAAEQLGYSISGLTGQSIDLVAPELKGGSASWSESVAFHAIKDNRNYHTDNLSLVKANGENIPVEVTITPLTHAENNLGGAILAFRDITEIKRSEELVISMMSIDQLTGLVNWGQFREELDQAVEDASTQEEELAVFLLDLDNFREFNDAFGHDAGDVLLTEVAQRLSAHFGSEQLITRLGGDEFAVLFRDVVKDDVKHYADEILGLLTEGFDIAGVKSFFTCSIGVATSMECNLQSGEMIRAADTALHYAKVSGKNNHQVYTEEMQNNVVHRIRISNELRQAVSANDFIAFYQPQVLSASGQVVGMEALVRWSHKDGIVYPNDFIHIAEDSGLIVKIGDFILQQAALQAKQWQDEGQDITVSVNVSARQLRHPSFVQKVLDTVSEVGVNPEKMELELTESILMEDPNHVIAMFNKLRENGIKIAIDDFGTGFSSLAYIRRLDFDALKIDRSFVKDLGQDSGADTIVRTIIAMAHSLGHKVIAEGVETTEHADFLRQHGCEMLQGYLYSKPLPVDQLRQYLNGQK